MKILIVHRLISSFGGAHKYLAGLIDMLQKQEWEVHLAINPNANTEDLIHQFVQHGTQLHFIDFDQLDPQGCGEALDQVIRKVCPDVIDFEAAAKSVRQAALNSPGFASSCAAKIFTMHLPIITDQSTTHHWRRNIPLTHQWRVLNQRKEFLALFDKGLSVSNYHARKMIKLLGLDNDFFTIIPNGVDVDAFKPSSETKRNAGKIKIVACGGLTRQKRFDLLVQAAKSVRDSSQDFEVAIAGEGVQRGALENSIRDYNLHEHVNLVGHVTDMPAFLRSGHIYVMSSDSEGFPYAAIEAMATGLPMVVTNAGELPYMVRNGMDGTVINCGEAAALAEALNILLNSAESRILMGESARKRATEEFNEVSTWARVAGFYNDIQERSIAR